MKVVVIGDVSWAGQYHVGDEAMTEAAVAQLKRHGAEVTLIAGDPELSAGHYRVDTIGRLGFRDVPRPEKVALLSTLESAFAGEAELPKALATAVDAVRRADAVVIAGGGNLNSNGEHHLFERLALTRIAEFFEVPLFVSSQSVGPQLSEDDAEIVREIVDHAEVFGVRERSSAYLMKALSAEPDKVVLTYDDAILTPDTDASSVPKVELTLPPTYVVGSFTFHVGDTELAPEEYHRTIAAALDEIVATCDVDIVLVPHMGVLGVGDEDDRDCLAHARIADGEPARAPAAGDLRGAGRVGDCRSGVHDLHPLPPGRLRSRGRRPGHRPRDEPLRVDPHARGPRARRHEHFRDPVRGVERPLRPHGGPRPGGGPRGADGTSGRGGARRRPSTRWRGGTGSLPASAVAETC